MYGCIAGSFSALMGGLDVQCGSSSDQWVNEMRSAAIIGPATKNRKPTSHGRIQMYPSTASWFQTRRERRVRPVAAVADAAIAGLP